MKQSSRIALLAFGMLAAACSEAVAPRSQAIDAPPEITGGVMTSLTVTDTVKFTMTIDPWQSSTFYLGAGNSVTFPAGSVCDPTRTAYGMGEWDKPCTAARTSVTETVKAWLDSKGHPRTSFSPDIRFVPSALPAGWVNITFADYQASLDPAFNILYCLNDKQGGCIDESRTDPTLLTIRNPVTGKVTRRIKHFSGYLVGAGDDSSGTGSFNKVAPGVAMPFVSPAPAPVKPSAAMTTAFYTRSRKSGYILASGH